MPTAQIEGQILEVMETWPLQLSVLTADGRYHVGLRLETRLTFQGRPADFAELRAKRRVRVIGQASGPNAIDAESIEILA